MHKLAMEMGKWALEQAKAHGFDNLSSQDWDDLKDCMDIVKSAVCADKEYRVVDEMDEFEKEYGRMGYRGRAANGRFVHRSGRGRSAGYTPYLHMMDDDMDEYGMFDEMPYPMTGYRMGYTTGGRTMNSGDMGNMENRGGHVGNSNSYGYADGNTDGRMGYNNSMKNHSRYGETYDRYNDRRRHYHETKDAESKKEMEESIGEVFDDMENVVQDVWKEMTPEQKQKYKTRMTQMVQKMQ